MFEENKDDKIYNLIISNSYDGNKEYQQFIEKVYSKTDFLWKESISSSYSLAGEEFYNKVDRIILLSGLYKENKETFHALLEASEKYKIPIVLVRPYGVEEVPEILENKAGRSRRGRRPARSWSAGTRPPGPWPARPAGSRSPGRRRRASPPPRPAGGRWPAPARARRTGGRPWIRGRPPGP